MFSCIISFHFTSLCYQILKFLPIYIAKFNLQQQIKQWALPPKEVNSHHEVVNVLFVLTVYKELQSIFLMLHAFFKWEDLIEVRGLCYACTKLFFL